MTTPLPSAAEYRGAVRFEGDRLDAPPEHESASGDESFARSRQVCAVLGHELRNPLASVVTSLEVVREMTDAEDPRTRFLERALGDLDRVGDLLHSYLDYGRGCRPERESVRLSTLLRDAACRCRAPEVHFGSAPDAVLDADPRLLGRALDNLIENALAVGACRIEIRGERALHGRLILTIEDDGPGVPAELQHTLFDAFVSGRGSSGLGLAIVREVVTAHGGAVASVGSRLGGAGFRIELPTTGESV